MCALRLKFEVNITVKLELLLESNRRAAGLSSSIANVPRRLAVTLRRDGTRLRGTGFEGTRFSGTCSFSADEKHDSAAHVSMAGRHGILLAALVHPWSMEKT